MQALALPFILLMAKCTFAEANYDPSYFGPGNPYYDPNRPNQGPPQQIFPDQMQQNPPQINGNQVGNRQLLPPTNRHVNFAGGQPRPRPQRWQGQHSNGIVNPALHQLQGVTITRQPMQNNGHMQGQHGGFIPTGQQGHSNNGQLQGQHGGFIPTGQQGQVGNGQLQRQLTGVTISHPGQSQPPRPVPSSGVTITTPNGQVVPLSSVQRTQQQPHKPSEAEKKAADKRKFEEALRFQEEKLRQEQARRKQEAAAQRAREIAREAEREKARLEQERAKLHQAAKARKAAQRRLDLERARVRQFIAQRDNQMREYANQLQQYNQYIAQQHQLLQHRKNQEALLKLQQTTGLTVTNQPNQAPNANQQKQTPTTRPQSPTPRTPTTRPRSPTPRTKPFGKRPR